MEVNMHRVTKIAASWRTFEQSETTGPFAILTIEATDEFGVTNTIEFFTDGVMPVEGLAQ